MIRAFTNKPALSIRNKWYEGYLKQFCELWFYSDLGLKGKDITTDLLPNSKCNGEIIAKGAGVVAGIEEVRWICKKYKVSSQFKVKDGSEVRNGDLIGVLRGNSNNILKIERLILNVIGKMSGIATNSARLKKMAPGITLVPTRKTDWGPMDKKACLVGGCGTHRLGLWDAVIIKDNHLALGFDNFKIPRDAKFVEVEVRNITQLKSIPHISTTVVVMLDNFRPSRLMPAIEYARELGHYIEISGGIHEGNLRQYARYKPDAISMSGLTRGVGALDVSLSTTP